MVPIITSSDVVAAFRTRGRFPVDSPQLEIFTPFVGHLVEIVGKDRLGDIVDFGNLCDVASRYLNWLIANEEFLGKLDPREAGSAKKIYSHLADQMKAMSDDPESTLASHGFTAEAFLMSKALGLNEAAKELARSGELTFAKLLTTSPDVFIPTLG